MNEELKKLLQAVRDHFKKAPANKDDFLTALKEENEFVDLRNDIYQVAFNDGHKTATDAHQGAKTKLQGQIDTAKAAQAAAEEALEKLKRENPDAARLHAEYGAQITQLKDQIKAMESTQLAERKGTRKEKIEAMVEAALVEMRVNPFQAKAMAQASRDQYIVGDDLVERILQPEKSTAYAGDVKTQAKALASELFKQVPKELVMSKVPGGGPGEKGTTTGDDGDEKRTVLQAAKEAAKNKFNTTKKDASGNTLNPQDEVNRRLGQRPR